MDESADQIFEEFQDIVQQAILREFPNPERKGCPGPVSLRELANRPRPSRDAVWEHVTHCSPCYQEFLDLRSQVKIELEGRRRAVLRRRVVVAAAIVVALAGGGIATYEISQRSAFRNPPAAGPYESASLDLKDRSVPRSVEKQAPKTQPLILPAKRLDLSIFLPVGSEPGRYDVQLLKKIDEPRLSVSAEATVQNGTTILRARLDLTGQTTGSFLIGLRQPPSDWTYYPVSIQ
jgi:hypothetical protein